MKNIKLTTNKKLFLKIIIGLLIFGIGFAYFSSQYMQNYAFKNLAEDDAQKTSELAFEVMYSKMQDGWSREDLYKVVNRLNHLRPGLEIKTFRSPKVEKLFGSIESEKQDKKNPLIQRALHGETIFIETPNNEIKYIRPIIVKQECITCHVNTKVGDINGVMYMSYPSIKIQIPLNQIISYFLVFTIIAIIVTFFIFHFLMTRIFINPISTFVSSIEQINKNQNFATSITCAPKTYEIYMLEKTFNSLLKKINEILTVLRSRNKELEEYKKAIDQSTIVSKSDLCGVITYVNEQFCVISGYTPDELIGHNHNIVRSQNMPKEAFRELWSTIKNKQIWKGVVENRTKNGKSYFVQATIIPILDENNEIVEYIGIRQDITALKELQFKELNENVYRALDIHYQQLLDLIPVNAVILDTSSAIHFSNSIFDSRFSYLNHKKIIFSSLFIEKEGYVSNNSLLDWKDLSINFQEECIQKVLINLFNQESEFYIRVKKIENSKYYLILLIEVNEEQIEFK